MPYLARPTNPPRPTSPVSHADAAVTQIVGPAGQNANVLLSEISETSRAVAATPLRRAKVELLASCLRDAEPGEVPIAVAYLSGELPQRQVGVGWAALRERPAPAPRATLTVTEVDAALTAVGEVSGKGSVAARRHLLGELFARATAEEQGFLIRLLSGELRQGALDGVMADAVAAAAGAPAAEVRRAVMFRGSLGAVAAAALAEGPGALRAFGLEVGRPVRPMLATPAPSVEAALAKVNPAAIEWKLDGIRVQAHITRLPDQRTPADPARSPDQIPAGPARSPDQPTPADLARSPSQRIPADLPGSAGRPARVRRASAELPEVSVRLFTRTLDEITDRVPETVAALAGLPVRSAVFDGELIALREDGRPHPFQVTSARAASRGGEPAVPLSIFLFDVLHLDGADLIDRAGAERHAALAEIVPEPLRMPRTVTGSVEEATAFFRDALAHGHEGVLVKALDSPYTAGRRGAGWIKVKPRHTLDLVVLAVEWGHGRRRGRLSNLHLGARDPRTGGFVMLGKTFKGLTDEMLAWQTEHLLALEERRDAWTVYVRPELVVEIAFDGVQRSSRYPGGLALRFARVLRHRPDKTAAEADTIDSVRATAAF
jgi:ATP-dependent DNA ligase